MTYSPYLIANYATGIDNRLQPWLSPDDSQQELFDGDVYRGVLSKRKGYQYFAKGERGGFPYRESRIIHTLTAVPMVGVIDTANTVFTLAATAQIARGSFKVTGTIPVQSFTDNGKGGFVGAVGTINYTTGAVSITLPAAPTAGTVTATYSFMPGKSVMMVANFITAANVKELVVADTLYVNRYNSTNNILEDISPATPYTGTNFDFFTWVNYASATNTPRLLFSNNKDNIQQYDGATVTDYVYNMIADGGGAVTDLTCSFMTQNKDRLILLRTTENGTVYPQRIRISGTGANSDDFRTSATGAGFIDISDGTWINGAAFNRDDLIIFTESSVWVMKYTGNDTTPFVLNKIDESRGCEATFSAITYLNRTSATSPRGLIMTDGYRVERQDLSIPDFSFNEISGENFSLCFAGSVDADRDHYLIYPPQGQDHSTRILVTNYDEDNYSIYRIPLSCMGTYVTAFEIKWSDLTPAKEFNNWDDLSTAYGNWNAFAYTAGAPFSIGGGHHGEIWILSVTQSEDNPVRIYGITIIDGETIQVTTDWNNYNLNLDDSTLGVDYIFLSGVSGMLEVNDQQYPISSVVSFNVFNLKVPNSSFFSAYTGGGQATRAIPFSALFKKFNPFADQDKKVRCGWMYMYVDATSSDLNSNIPISFADQTFPLLVTTATAHDISTGELVRFFGVVGMVELNGQQAYATRVNPTVLLFQSIDATAYTPYVSGGYVAAPVPAKMAIDIITNDNGQNTQTNIAATDPYEGSCTNLVFQNGFKKWYKVYINQVGIFIQFRLRNVQAGAIINVQATMPGFQAVGRII